MRFAAIAAKSLVRQRGLSLVIGLIMLFIMTLIAIASFQLGSDQTVVVANAQQRNEGIDAAQQAIEIVVNSISFTQNPAVAIPTSNCSGGGANRWCVDTTGDGTNDFTVTLAPQPSCVTAASIPMSQLDFSKADDLACVAGSRQDFGVTGAMSSSDSLCANATWEISAQAADAATGTMANVVQGVSLRIATNDMANYCP